jgi:hypothetical protein
LPAWVELRRAPPNPDLPTYLDDGERDAIALALHLGRARSCWMSFRGDEAPWG